MNSKPLTYHSLKTVLQYLEPNIRFLISIRIPSLRVTERSVPLKIECLHFSNSQFVINETSYSLNVCSEGRDVLFTSSSNSDVNEYGEEDEISKRTVLPGDVVLRPLDPHPTAPAMTEERMHKKIEYYAKEIETNRLRLARLNSMTQAALQNLVEVPTYYNQDPFNTFLHGNEAQMRALGDSPEVEEERRNAVALTEITIELNEQYLRPLLNRRDNVRPSFEIELKITSPSGVRTERVKYTAKLHLAEKSLLKMMFGNRKHVVQVKKLVIYQFLPIRFPLGLKMKIRELQSIRNIRHLHSALSPVVINSSYPLEKLEIGYVLEFGQDIEHEVVKSAKSLVLFSAFFDTPMLPIFLNLQNDKVYARDYGTMTTAEHVQLIKSWLEMGKPNGTCYTFPMLNEKKGNEILEMVEQQCHGAVMEDKCVVIPMSVSSKLKLSNELINNSSQWAFKMEVMPRGFC